MRNHKFKVALITLIIMCSSALGLPLDRFNNKGVLVDQQDCLLFKPVNQEEFLFELDNYGDFQAGDSALVSGKLVFDGQYDCPAADGLIRDNTISDIMTYQQLIIEIIEGYDIESIISDFQGYIIDSIETAQAYLVDFPPQFPIAIVLEALENNPSISFSHPNYIMGFPETFQISQQFPDESIPPLLAGVSPPAYYSDSGVYSIGIDSANLMSTGNDVIVAVIDNGIDFNHPLFDENALYTYGYDLIEDDLYAEEDSGSVYGHGTFISGVIKRVAPDVKILPIKAFDGNGYTNSFMIADAIYTALNDTADVKIINMSFGTYSDIAVIREAVEAARMQNKILISAPGNDNSTAPSYPSAYTGVISVSALDSLDYRADFSNHGTYIDICAPGVNIYSSLAGQYQWGYWSGTSFAAPMAAGICALMSEVKPDIGPFEAETYLKLTADRTLDWGTLTGFDIEYGYGRANAFNAMILVKRGDVDNSNDMNVLDIVYLIEYVFHDGPPPVPAENIGDYNCSDDINILDIIDMIETVFKSGQRSSCF